MVDRRVIAKFATVESNIDQPGAVVIEWNRDRACLRVFVDGGMLPDGTEHAEFALTERSEAIEFAMDVVAAIEEDFEGPSTGTVTGTNVPEHWRR